MGARPSSRRRQTADESQEINLIPLMNVFCILIPFLLLTAVFVQLTIINTNLPNAAPSIKKGDEESPTPDIKKLNLTVFITKEGFILAGYGGVLNVDVEGKASDDDKDKKRTVILKKVIGKDRDGNDILDYDYGKLQTNLIKIKETFLHHYSIILLPENHVKYETIIKTLDASREYSVKKADGTEEIRELFVSPVLAGGIT